MQSSLPILPSGDAPGARPLNTMWQDAVSADLGDDEARLVERAKERSPSAWAEIYDRYYRKLYRYCYARTGDQATAADLASRVYLEALEGIEGYTYQGRPFLAWFYRIARNLVSDHFRSRQRETAALERSISGVDGQDGGPAAAIADRYDLSRAIGQLTEDQQQVIALRYYSGFSTAEIAEAMDRSERAVYSLEVRALVALRKLLTTLVDGSANRVA